MFSNSVPNLSEIEKGREIEKKETNFANRLLKKLYPYFISNKVRSYSIESEKSLKNPKGPYPPQGTILLKSDG